MIRIRLNGEPTEVPAATTIADVVAAHARSERGTAVARNREVVPRSAWTTVTVAEGDDVEILAAAQGG